MDIQQWKNLKGRANESILHGCTYPGDIEITFWSQGRVNKSARLIASYATLFSKNLLPLNRWALQNKIMLKSSHIAMYG